MNTFTVFSTTGATIIAPFATIAAKSATLAAAMIPYMIAGLTIMIMWHGYETIRGKGGPNIFLDVFALSVRVGLVWALGLTAYSTNVIGLIDSVIGDLSTLFGSGTTVTGSSGAGSALPALIALDASCQSALNSMNTIWDVATGTNGHSPPHIVINITTASDFSGVMMIAQGFVMLLAFGIYACIAALELLYIQIALIIFYAVGPIFIAMYAFKGTEQWFSSWLQGLMTYVMTAVVIAIMIGMGNAILADYTAKIATNLNTLDFIETGLASMCASVMLIFLIMKVPELAGKIAGGIGISTVGSSVGTVNQAMKDYFANRSSSTRPSGTPIPAPPPTPATPKVPSAALAGISKGIGAAMRGTGEGVGSAIAGTGSAIGGIGRGIGHLASTGAQGLASRMKGTGTITGSNARPAGQGMQSMFNKTNNS